MNKRLDLIILKTKLSQSLKWLSSLFLSSFHSRGGNQGETVGVAKAKAVGVAKGVGGSRQLNSLHLRDLNLDSRGSSVGETKGESSGSVGDRARDKGVELVLSLLQLNQSGISRGVSLNRLKGSSLVLDLGGVQ